MATDEADFFEIDKNNLDEEWVRQPALYHKHAMLLADARREYDRRKSELEVLAAELDREIRSSPIKFGLEKITETVVANTILLQPSHRNLQKVVINAKHDVAIAEAAVSAMEHKKKGLESSVQLWLSDYWSDPKLRATAQSDFKAPNRNRKKEVEN